MVNKILDDYIDSVSDGKFLVSYVSPGDFTLEVIKRLQWGQKYNFNVTPKYPGDDERTAIRRLLVNQPHLHENIEAKVEEKFNFLYRQAIVNFENFVNNAGINPLFIGLGTYDFQLNAAQARLLMECPQVERVTAWFKGTVPII